MELDAPAEAEPTVGVTRTGKDTSVEPDAPAEGVPSEVKVDVNRGSLKRKGRDLPEPQ